MLSNCYHNKVIMLLLLDNFAGVWAFDNKEYIWLGKSKMTQQ